MDAIGLRLTLAYGLDLILGDPLWLPHPIRGLGWAIQKGERFLRRLIANEVLAGAFLLGLVTLGTLGLVQGTLGLAARHSQNVALALEVAFLYVCLSTKDLAVESWPVYKALRQGDLSSARKRLSMIVGRDTEKLNEPEIVRGTVETIGESLMDGVISPLFYAALGGVGWACLYKAVNTLDSMVGYRSSRYIRFGRATAAVDRWMNALPAWITAFLIAGASFLMGGRGRGSLQAFLADPEIRRENSWIPEAAMAGALGVQVGGTNFYQGKAAQTPRMGRAVRALDQSVIPQAIRLMYAASFLALLAAVGFRWIIG